MMPTLALAQAALILWMKQYMLSVSRAVEERYSCRAIPVGIIVCVCARVCACVRVRVTQHHCPLPEGTRRQYLNFICLKPAQSRCAVLYYLTGMQLESSGEER